MLQGGPHLALGAHLFTTEPFPGEEDASDHVQRQRQQQQPQQQHQHQQRNTSWTERPPSDPPQPPPSTGHGGPPSFPREGTRRVSFDEKSRSCSSLVLILDVASRRCFDVSEIIDLLTPGVTPLPLSSEPPGGGIVGRDPPPPPPESGTLLLYDRVATRDYKRDGHSWVTKRVSSRKRGNKVAESSVKLRLDGRFRVAGWYAKSDGGTAPPTMRRRAYYTIDPDTMRPLGDWVLVHYLDDEVAAAAVAADSSSSSTSMSVSIFGKARNGAGSLGRNKAPRGMGVQNIPREGQGGTPYPDSSSSSMRMSCDHIDLIREGEGVSGTSGVGTSLTSMPELVTDDEALNSTAAEPEAPSIQVKKVRHDDGGDDADAAGGRSKSPTAHDGDDKKEEAFSISGALSSFCDLRIAPRLTDEDVAREWESSFTEVEKRRAMTDVYGSVVGWSEEGDAGDGDGDGIENGQRQPQQEQQPADPTTPRSVTPCDGGPMLESMDNELEMIPRHIKSDYLEARMRCPNLCSSDEFKSWFLRCEAHCPKAAAHRMVQYWRKRVEIFGADRAFLPLTLSGAMAEDCHELSTFARLLPGTDASGRGIIFFDNTTTCSFMTRLRSSFYMAHAALENDGARQNGVVLVVFGPPPLAHVDKGLMLERQALFRDVLPVKVRAVHKCLFRKRDDGDRNIPRAYEVLNFTAGREWRARMVAHDGSSEQLVLQLGEYGISISQLPSKIGGLVGDDYFTQWFELRRRMGL